MVRQYVRTLIAKLRVVFRDYALGKYPYLLTSIASISIFIFGINVFVDFSRSVMKSLLNDFDNVVTNEILKNRTTELTHYFTFMTEVGDMNGYIAVMLLTTVVLYTTFGNWKYILRTFLILLIATFSNVVLKKVFSRARPDIEHLVSVKTLSYPSGHAMSSIAFYGFLIYLLYKYNLPIYLKIFFIMLLSLIITSIGVSRIYLGVHYPSDIVGGWIAGGLWVVLSILIFNIMDVYRNDSVTKK